MNKHLLFVTKRTDLGTDEESAAAGGYWSDLMSSDGLTETESLMNRTEELDMGDVHLQTTPESHLTPVSLRMSASVDHETTLLSADQSQLTE